MTRVTIRTIDNHEVERDEILYDSCGGCSMEITPDVESVENQQGDTYCNGCYDDYYFICRHCEEESHMDDVTTIHSEDICVSCRDSYYDTCPECDDWCFVDDMHYSDNTDCDVCESCYDYNEESDYNSSDSVSWSVMNNDYVATNTDFENPKDSGYNMTETGNVRKNMFDVTYSERTDFKDSFSMIKSRRYQGVEIEFNTFNDVDRGELFQYLHGDILMSRTNRFRRSDWSDYMKRMLNVVYDGSVTGGEHSYGSEVVMFPRRGDVLIKDIDVINKAIKKMDGYISHKCGYHLHIDVRDYDWYHFAVLIAMTKLVEPHIFRWMPSSRRTSRWCQPVTQNWSEFSDIGSRESLVDFYYDGDNYRDEKYHDKRYSGLNLHSHFQGRQGVEMRYHSGTLNTDKMKHWSILWSQIVDKSYEIGNELHDKYAVYGSDGTDDWFANTPFIKSLQNVVSDELKTDILNIISVNGTKRDRVNDIKLKLSRDIRRELGIDIEQNLPYMELDLDRLSSLVGIRSPMGIYNSPTMTMDNMFKVFDLPNTTREFYRNWCKTRESSSSYDPNHVEKCYGKTTRFVEYHKFSNDFSTKSMIEHRLPRVNSLSSIYQDLRYRLEPRLISEYINV